MKIAILTSGILPVPAVQGGAVENLIDSYLEYNENILKEHDITILSIYDHKLKKLSKLNSIYNHYVFFNMHSILSKIERKIFSYFHKKSFYSYYIEFYLSKCIKYLNKNNFDIIIVENRPGYIIPLSQITRSKIILHLHNDFLNINTPNYKKILDNCSAVFVVSNYIKKRVETIYSSDKIRVVHNGISLNNFKRYPVDNCNLKKKLGFDDNDFIVVFSGRIMKEKGVKELIEAFLLLEERNIKLLIIGGAFFGKTDYEDNYIKEIKTLAKPIINRIIFTGYVAYSEIPNYLSLANIAVIPSLWDDPFPTTVLEGLAAGLPLVVTDSGGILEAIDDNCAIVIKRNNTNFIKDMHDAIWKIYNDSELRSEMSIASFNRSKLFSKELFAYNFFHEIKCSLR